MRYAAGAKVPERRLAACLGSDLRRYSRASEARGTGGRSGLHAREIAIQPGASVEFHYAEYGYTLARS